MRASRAALVLATDGFPAMPPFLIRRMRFAQPRSGAEHIGPRFGDQHGRCFESLPCSPTDWMSNGGLGAESCEWATPALRCVPWRGVEDVEFATLAWVAWYNDDRLLEALGYVAPAEFEQAYYARQTAPDSVAVLNSPSLRETRGGSGLWLSRTGATSPG